MRPCSIVSSVSRASSRRCRPIRAPLAAATMADSLVDLGLQDALRYVHVNILPSIVLVTRDVAHVVVVAVACVLFASGPRLVLPVRPGRGVDLRQGLRGAAGVPARLRARRRPVRVREDARVRRPRQAPPQRRRGDARRGPRIHGAGSPPRPHAPRSSSDDVRSRRPWSHGSVRERRRHRRPRIPRGSATHPRRQSPASTPRGGPVPAGSPTACPRLDGERAPPASQVSASPRAPRRRPAPAAHPCRRAARRRRGVRGNPRRGGGGGRGSTRRTGGRRGSCACTRRRRATTRGAQHGRGTDFAATAASRRRSRPNQLILGDGGARE